MSEIVLVDLDAGTYVRMTTDIDELTDGSDNSPVFSPDGTRIAWVRGLEDQWRKIVVQNVSDAATPGTWTAVPGQDQGRFKGALDW
jgi:Tol biopolymer transport system component